MNEQPPTGRKSGLFSVLALVGIALVVSASLVSYANYREHRSARMLLLKAQQYPPAVRHSGPPAPPVPAASAAPVTSAIQAVRLVRARPEVRAWQAQIERARREGRKRSAQATVERDPRGDYVVHVFESVEDEQPGHTATFGWFKVNHSNGAIRNTTIDSD